MHERTRRTILRMLFVFCCATPTLAVLASIMWTWTPWARQRVNAKTAAQISLATGTLVELDAVHVMSPHRTEIETLTLREPESAGEILRVRRLEFSCDDAETAVVLQQPELQSSKLPSAWQIFDHRFLRRPDLSTPDYRIAANDLTLHADAHSLTLRDVDAWMETDDQGVTGNLQAVLAAQPTGSPILVNVRRHRGEAARTTWSIETGPHRIPISILGQFRPEIIDHLGPDATLQGTLSWTHADDNLTLDLSGTRLENVSLDRLLSDSPYRLSGTASIELQRGRIDRGRRIDLAGTVTATDGRISDELLMAAAIHLDCEVAQPDTNQAEIYRDLRFDHLAIHFQINDSQMRIEGVCRSRIGFETLPVGVAACIGHQPLMITNGGTMETIRLASLLAPKHAVAVPIASQNQWLAAWLPPPSQTPHEIASRYRPKIRSTAEPVGGTVMRQPRR